ncbi:hypothetical protein ACEPAG_1747 [Sanghuangporus baumii]
MDAESSSPASCRIVVVSSSLETSREIAYRIKALSGDTSESPNSSEVIHWTIKNKYYTAPVHFHPIHLEGLEFIELDDVPAVIYAWKENEPYRTHMKQVVEQTSSCNLDVSLAISMAPTTDEELEDFFFKHGFEYVEGHTEEEADRLDPSATPGIRRAVDALSTIMWPSMVRTDQLASMLASQSSNSVATEGEDEIDIDYRALMNEASDNGRSNIQHELEMLEKWLDDDDDDDENYENADDKNGGYTSLDSHEQSFSNDPWTTSTPGVPTNAEGFDDDFTEFISVPSTSRTESKLHDDSDSDLPSQADIQAASARIFGLATSSHSKGPDSSRGKSARNDPELDMDSPAFDLTRILGALDTMKDEISKMPDVRERRRAAAKAALGFVYGLEETNSELDAAAHLA